MADVTPSPGDEFGNFKIEETNVEKDENRASKKRGFQKFPMHVHKPNHLVREVHSEAELADALAKGWYADVRDVPADADGDGVPDRLSEMTLLQAARAIAKASPKELAELEADEIAHGGGREAVLALIAEAKDAVPTAAPKAAKGKKPKAAAPKE